MTEARWRVFSYPSGSASDFYVDAVVMIPEAELAMAPVSGSWRREIQP